MPSKIRISMLMGLLLCFVSNAVEVRGSCVCSEKIARANTGSPIERKITGNCLAEDNSDDAGDNFGRKFCYVDDTDQECCQKSTETLPGYCINYDLCDPKPKCECSDLTANTNTGLVIGNCLTVDNNKDAGLNSGRKWCYVEKGDGSCCQNTSIRFAKYCVNYDACGLIPKTSTDDE